MIKNHKLWAFWTWSLLKASHKQYTQKVGFQEINIEPGQFIFGRKAAAEELGISEQSIRTCLMFLIKSKNLTSKTTNKFSIISIVNWSIYQCDDAINQPANQQTTNQQLTTNKNVKNVKNIYTPDFEKFWEAYPNKKCGKMNTWKSWNKLNGTRPEINILLMAVQNQSQSFDWKKNNGQFIPMATTWLNQNRWDAVINHGGVKNNPLLANCKFMPESEKEFFPNDPF